ncbi:MAG: hypothetical protein EOM90_11125 [Alphaproteobacteria bacterium]|nr:hypothetical protein [Alphaproteobacteria bacterium]
MCEEYNIEPDFILELYEFGLIDLTELDEQKCIRHQTIGELERMIHLRYELDINVAGIEAIGHLLNRVESLQQEVITLRNQLQRWL